jgi:hypothetical protein
LCSGAVLMLLSVALDALWPRCFRTAFVADEAAFGVVWIACGVLRAGMFPIFRGETRGNSECKKRHARVKKAIFRLESRFFSSSIRSASGNADSHW